MHDESTECNNTAAAVSLQQRTNSHTAFLCCCSLAHCCYPGVPRSVISTSMEEYDLMCEISGIHNLLSLFTSTSCLETQCSPVNVREVSTQPHRTAATRFRSISHWWNAACTPATLTPPPSLFCNFSVASWFLWHPRHRFYLGVCLFYPERYNKWIVYHEYFVCLCFGKIQK